MATSEVQICNQALAHIGSSTLIADLTEDSKEGRLAKLFYETTRDAMLEEFDWRFASRRATLNVLSTSTRSDWTYVYVLPTDCIAVRQIVPGTRVETADTRIPFDLDADANGKTVLLCDQSPVELRYTAQIKEVGRFPPLFAEALAWALAVKFSVPIAVKRELREDAVKGYLLALENAVRASMTERREDPPPVSEFESSRA